jgi:hypothetical protein
MKKPLIILMLAMMLPAVRVMAEGLGDGLSLKVKAGYSIGASAPYGMPEAIEGIDAFRLTPSFCVGVDATLPLDEHCGVSAGFFVERKSMDVAVRTKGYHMEMRQGTESIEGVFTGHVGQQISMLMLTLPVCATYAISPKVELRAGVYGSLLLSNKFTGVASDGYIRRGGPTGPKIIIGDTPESQATYDFSDDMRKLQAGATVGVDWLPWSRLGFSLDFTMGFTGIFKVGFKTVEQPLYPIYGTLGVFYKFL